MAGLHDATWAEWESREREKQMGVKEVSRGGEQGAVFTVLKHHLGHSCITQEALSISSFLFIEI